MQEHFQGEVADFEHFTAIVARRPEFNLDLLGDLSESRKAILDELVRRRWFMVTNPDLQNDLMFLPENHNGFLEDLAARPEEVGGLIVEEMVGLPRGAFALVPKFRVTRADDGKEFTYEYVSWRQGPDSGAKGLVLVENEGQYTHFVILNGDKFAVGGKVFDAVGGFVESGENGDIGLQENFLREIREELGVPDLKVKRMIPLGKVLPDAGMTNNHPGIFGAVIDGSEAQRLTDDSVYADVYELKSGPVVFPITQLKELVMVNDDQFFLTTVVRLIANGELKLE